MSFFRRPPSSPSLPAEPLPAEQLESIAARYRRNQPLRLRLNEQLLERLPKQVIWDGAARLGMLSEVTSRSDPVMIAFKDESEMAVLSDYCIYNVYRDGRNAIDQYLCDVPLEEGSAEMALLQAMQHATYTLIVIRRLEPGVGCYVENLFTGEQQMLADFSLSRSAKQGWVLATRLVDFGDFVSTGGAALPVGVPDDEELDEWQEKLMAAVDAVNEDPAPLIRACLECNTSQRIIYTDAPGRSGQHRPPLEASTPLSQRKRLQQKRQASQSKLHRRCSCGSGKMFKNCCGRR